MIVAHFEEILEDTIKKLTQTLSSKGKEYSSNHDRLHNFKKAAELMRVTQADACLSFMTKHIISVIDLVKSGETPSDAMIDEKIGDVIAYCVLLKAIWKEDSWVLN